MTDTTISHLDALEAESIHIMREVAAEFERPVLLFSGGKDSALMLKLAEKAFWPARIPFPLMHVDTGHNFPEVLDYRDRRAAELGAPLVVASVQKSIDEGRVHEETGPKATRNRLQSVTLLDGIEEHGFDAVFGGGGRRRRQGPGQGAGLQLPRRLRPVGPQEPAARAVEPLQRPAPQGRAHPRVPHLQLDRDGRVAIHRPRGHRAAVDLLRAPARGVPPRRHAARAHTVRDPAARRRAQGDDRAVPHRG